MYDLIQQSGLDGWIEGPPIMHQQLRQVVSSMQALKRQQQMSLMMGQQGGDYR